MNKFYYYFIYELHFSIRKTRVCVCGCQTMENIEKVQKQTGNGESAREKPEHTYMH